MTEAEKRRAEAIWTYEISLEKALKRLATKGIFTQEHADYMSEQFFEQLNDLKKHLCNSASDEVEIKWMMRTAMRKRRIYKSAVH